MANDYMTLREALEKLSPEDRERYRSDVLLLGSGFIKQHKDGTVTYVPPADWPDLRNSKQK